MTTAARSSVIVLLVALLLTGCASGSRTPVWGHEHDLSSRGYWGLEGGRMRFYPSEHPSSSPIPHPPHDHGDRP